MTLKTKKLFISYRSSDALQVDQIAQDLGLIEHDDGTPRYAPWQDKKNLPPASPNWWDAIVDAIIDCDVFVFHMSADSLQSKVCLAELDYAHKRNRPIVPIVLQGEFFLNDKTGKYDIDYWNLVPEWLGNAQFLFYTGANFYAQFQKAIAQFERNWPRDIDVRRPLNPDSESVHGNNHAVYGAACDYAARLAFEEAEKHFSTLLKRNDADYADIAADWLELLDRYKDLLDAKRHRAPRAVFRRKWQAYVALFPLDFIDDLYPDAEQTPVIFDPQKIGQSPQKLAKEPQPPPVEKPKQLPAQPKPTQSKVSSVPGKSTQAKPTAKDILPAPFDWVEIPGGRGTMKTNEENVTLQIPTETYWMGKYPVTNAQFAKFIEAGGYNNQKWWTQEGWQYRVDKGWAQPRDWGDSAWNGAEQPVIGVSWFEAVAFCQWLAEAAFLPSGQKIMLPTEAQWQYAAQGTDGREYPWGNDFDKNRCNSKESGIGKTTPVTRYAGKGDSPFGVVDMAGNVWEWCLTDYHDLTNDVNTKANRRVLRGGSWGNDHGLARAAYRDYGDPYRRGYVNGFVLVRAPSR